ncbi:MAG TPA: glycosyltransferase family 4 protein, partial [Ignavibacteriaceae bacterium]|nr:glycosyltransferase family 4 protein [Ignavibacteriaceae bacterium]
GRTKVLYALVKGLEKWYPAFEVSLITNLESDLRIFNKLNIQKHIVPISLSKRNVFNFLRALFLLFFIIKKSKIELVHSHHRYSDLLISILSKFLYFGTVTTVHSIVFGRRLLSFNLDAVVSVSAAVGEHIFSNFRTTRAKCYLIHNGIFLDEIEFPNPINNDVNVTRILCVGRLDFEKGQDILLRALEGIDSIAYKIEVCFVGGYSENIVTYSSTHILGSYTFVETFQNLVKRSSHTIRIIQSETTPWDEILKANFVVIPSRIETFGLVALESGLAKRFVIAAKTGGLPEIIREGENGLLFTSENIQELRHAILFAIKNKYQIEKLSENLHTDVINNFTAELMTKKYVALYEKLLNQT